MVIPVLLWLSTASLFANASVAWLSGGPSTYYPTGAGYVDGQINSDVQYHTPCGLAIDQTGNYLLVADRDNNQIRVLQFDINNTATLLTYSNNIQVTNLFTKPVGVAIDDNYNIFVLNYGNGHNGTVMQFDNEGDLLATNLANITNAAGLAIDSSDNVYVTAGNAIYEASFTGVTSVVTTITNAGTSLQGIVVKHNGLLAVCDAGRDGILLVDPATGIVTTNAGFHGQGDFITVNNYSYSNQAKFFQPMGVAETGDGTLIVSDYGNDRVKAVLNSGVVTNIYGVLSNDWVSPFPGFANGTVALPDKSGGVAARQPNGVVFAPDGSIYVSEDYYHILRHVTGTGLVLKPSPPPAATIIYSVTTNFGLVTLSWYAVDTATNYDVERAPSTGGPYTIIAQTTATSYTDTNVVAGGTYFYVIAALNNGGASSNSPEVSATVPVPPPPAPTIGWFDYEQNGFGTYVTVNHPISAGNPFVTYNAVLLAVEPATNGLATYYIDGPAPLTNAPSVTNGSTPPFYYDGNPNFQPSLPVTATPDLVIKAASANAGGSSAVTTAEILFETANPTILGNNAAQFTVSDITSNVTYWYTIDGSVPTNSPPSIGPIVQTGTNLTLSLDGSTNVLFQIRAFRNGYQPSGIAEQLFSPSGFVPNTISFGFSSGEASSDFVGAPGQTFYAPVTLTPLSGLSVYSMQFNVTVTNGGPNPGPAVAPGAFSFTSMLKKPDTANPGLFLPIPPYAFASTNSTLVTNTVFYDGSSNFVNLEVTNVSENLLGVGWLERFSETNLYNTKSQDLIQFSIAHDTLFQQGGGKVVLGGYEFQIPTNAVAGQTYQIQIGRPSASSDGIGAPGSAVFIFAPTNGSPTNGAINAYKVVTAGQRKYIVGDAYPFRWFNAGDFGDTNLDVNDVQQVFNSAAYDLNNPTWQAPGSDFADSMDSCGSIGVLDSNNGYYTNSFSYITGNQGQVNALFDGNDTTINQITFGDGVLDVCDVYVTYRRSLDPSLTWYRRFWTNGILAADTTANVFKPNLVQAPQAQLLSKVAGGSNSSITNQPKVVFTAGDIQGSAGQTLTIPINATIIGNYPLRVLMLNLTVAPLDGSPDLTIPVQFSANATLGQPYTTASSGNDNYAGVWLNSTNTGLTGTAVVGTLTVTLPTNATAMSAYAVHFDHASASPNGLASFPKQTLTGLITLSSRNASSFGDGIPDSWRLRYFGTTNNLLSAGSADADGDGYSNWQEYVAGTDPMDSTSKLVAGNDQPAAQQSGDSVVCWPSVSGKQYVIQRSPTLFPATWTSISTNTGTGGNMEIHDLNGGPGRFYRVSVQ